MPKLLISYHNSTIIVPALGARDFSRSPTCSSEIDALLKINGWHSFSPIVLPLITPTKPPASILPSFHCPSIKTLGLIIIIITELML